MNANTEYEREVATVPATDLALVSAVSKAELDQQITTARAFPRSVKRFHTECFEMATLNAEVAASCMYALPRGGKSIEGPSARMAEIIQSAWGNNRSGQRIVDEGQQFITAQGIFHDLERNVQITVEVKRRITDKHGKRFDTDMIGVTGNAAASIAHRNAVLKGVPKAFWQTIYQAARKVAIGDAKTLVARRSDALGLVQKMGVPQEVVFAALGVQGDQDIGLDELAVLRGALEAIKSGELTIEAAFAPKEGFTEAPKPTAKGKPKTAEPKKRGGGSKDTETKITMDQVTVIKDRLNAEGIPESLLLANLEIGSVEDLPASKYALANEWLDAASKPEGAK